MQGFRHDDDLTATGGVPVNGDLAAETTLLEDPEAGDTSVEYLVRVDGDTFDGLPVFSFDTKVGESKIPTMC